MSADFKWTLWIMLYNGILKVVNVLEYCEDFEGARPLIL